MSEDVKDTAVVEPKRRGRPAKQEVVPSINQEDMGLLLQELRSLRARNVELESAIARATPAPEQLPNQYELERILEQFLGKPEVHVIRQQGSLPHVLARYQPLLEAALKWEAQEPCSYCHARPGYNPLTGIWVRSWDANKVTWIDGHHASCKTLMIHPLLNTALLR